jgi:hypothetical protein
VTLTAYVDSVSANAHLTIDLIPGGVSVTPDSTWLAAGDQVQLGAAVLDSGGSVLPGLTAEWMSGDDAVAAVDDSGLVTAIGPGSGAVLAKYGSFAAASRVTVFPSPLKFLSLTANTQATCGVSTDSLAYCMDTISRAIRPILEPRKVTAVAVGLNSSAMCAILAADSTALCHNPGLPDFPVLNGIKLRQIIFPLNSPCGLGVDSLVHCQDAAVMWESPTDPRMVALSGKSQVCALGLDSLAYCPHVSRVSPPARGRSTAVRPAREWISACVWSDREWCSVLLGS